VKPLTADEYAWAKAQGNDGAVVLAEALMARGEGRFARTDRPSVIPRSEA
jgi:hypothetical protein